MDDLEETLLEVGGDVTFPCWPDTLMFLPLPGLGIATFAFFVLRLYRIARNRPLP